MRAKLLAGGAIALGAIAALTGCAPRGSDSPYWGARDDRAVLVCEQLLGGAGGPQTLGAADATIADARTIASASGLSPDDDPNFVDRDDSEYVALCLVQADFDTYLFYQFDGEPRSAVIAKY